MIAHVANGLIKSIQKKVAALKLQQYYFNYDGIISIIEFY